MTLRLTKKLKWRCLLCVAVASAALVILVVAMRIPINPGERHTDVAINAVPRHSLRVPELKITNIVQHGHIVEIEAKVEPGATVMINGEKAAVIWEDGEIKHFVGPLPDGVNDIAITVQNDDGGINSKQLSVVLP